MKIFITSFLIMLIGQITYAFPIWGLCRIRFVQCFSHDYKKERCNLLDNTQRVVINSKNVVVRIHRVTQEYVWIITGPNILMGGSDTIRKLPESSCRPLVRRKK